MNDDLVTELRVLSGSRKIYPSGAHGQMVGMETYKIVASGFALDCIDVASDEIESLRHQLATIRATWLSPESYETLMRERSETLHELAQYRRDFDYSQTELYAALAAIKLKDEALSKIEYLESDNGSILSAGACSSIATQALNIQPDDTALKSWLGEPRSYLYKFNSEFGDGTFYSHRPTHNGNAALESVPLYAPK